MNSMYPPSDQQFLKAGLKERYLVERRNHRFVELTIPAAQIPEVFASGKTTYLYHLHTRRGCWAAPTDLLFRQWQTSTNTVLLKLFEVGTLPRAALIAAAAQGIRQPSWRDRLRALPGWVVCQATLEQIAPERWRVVQSQVAYVPEVPGSERLTPRRGGASPRS